MEIDYSALGRVAAEFIENYKRVFEEICKAFSEAWDKIKPCLLDLYEVLKEVKYEEKIRFKPILEIRPNKIIFLNKRLNMYHCRSNL